MIELENKELSHNQPEFSVSEISYALKKTVETSFSHVRVRGEISGLKRHTSGHLYYALKDDSSVISCVSWRGSMPSFNKDMQDGIEVICIGRITTYPGRSQYQLVVEKIEMAGIGALMALLEKRKQQLAKEGLFDESRKKQLPAFPRCIGVITSPTGAVIRDIMHRLSDRFPVHVILWPVAVQGEGAAEQVAAAIEGFNNLPKNITKPDIIIVARGGGSIEDLWAFNEEVVVRAAAGSKIPLISAVGHETDTTLIDYASDRRAPTPTAAAEMAVPVRAELMGWLMDTQKRLFVSVLRNIQEKHSHLKAASSALLSPRQLLENIAQKLDDWSERLINSIQQYLSMRKDKLKLYSANLRPAQLVQQLEKSQAKLQSLSQLLDSYHYEKVLGRGYALLWDGNGKIITSAATLTPGKNISLQLKDGSKSAVVEGGESSPAKPSPAKSPRKKSSGGNQDSMF